jgi:hypothetical protein
MVRVMIKKKNEERFLGTGNRWTNKPDDAIDFKDLFGALLVRIYYRIDGEIVCIPEDQICSEVDAV